MEEKIQNHLKGKKRVFYDALYSTLGNVSEATRRTGISRRRHYDWIKEDEQYKDAILDLEEINLDFAESCLKKLMKEGNPTAIIFYLKTKGKKRGYIEQNDLEIKDFPEVKINIINPEPIKEEQTQNGADGNNRVFKTE